MLHTLYFYLCFQDKNAPGFSEALALTESYCQLRYFGNHISSREFFSLRPEGRSVQYSSKKTSYLHVICLIYGHLYIKNVDNFSFKYCMPLMKISSS